MSLIGWAKDRIYGVQEAPKESVDRIKWCIDEYISSHKKLNYKLHDTGLQNFEITKFILLLELARAFDRRFVNIATALQSIYGMFKKIEEIVLLKKVNKRILINRVNDSYAAIIEECTAIESMKNSINEKIKAFKNTPRELPSDDEKEMLNASFKYCVIARKQIKEIKTITDRLAK